MSTKNKVTVMGKVFKVKEISDKMAVVVVAQGKGETAVYKEIKVVNGERGDKGPLAVMRKHVQKGKFMAFLCSTGTENHVCKDGIEREKEVFFANHIMTPLSA